MINFYYLHDGDTIEATDEMRHRGKWLPVTDFFHPEGKLIMGGEQYFPGMKIIRRKLIKEYET